MGKGAMTRERILDEAMRLASRDGLEGLSIGRLATALELSKSGLFAHFGSKEALQVAVLAHTAARFRERLGPVEAAPPGAARIRALLKATQDWVDDPALPGGCPIVGACFELDDREGGAREALVAGQRATHAWLVEQFAACGPFADPAQLVFEYRAITLAYHHAARVLRDPEARERAECALEALLQRAGQAGG